MGFNTAESNAAIALVIARAQGGDGEAMTEMMALVGERALLWCRRRVSAWEERATTREDIAQEVCLAVLIMLPRRRWDDGWFWPMVYGVIHHKVVDVRRRVGRSLDEPCAQVPDTVDELTTGHEHGAVSGENVRHLAGLLLCAARGLPHDSVAARGVGPVPRGGGREVRLPPGATRGQHRGLTRLRRHIAATHDGAIPALTFV